MEDEECGGIPHRIMQCTDQFLKDEQLHVEGPHPWQELNGGIKDELAIGTSDNIAMYLHKSKDGKEFKDQKNKGIKHCEEETKLYLKKESAPNNKSKCCINDNNTYNDLPINNHEKHEELQEKDVVSTNSEEGRCEEGKNVCSENIQTEEKDEAVVDKKEDENKRAVIGWIDAMVQAVNCAEPDNTVEITVQPKNAGSRYEDSENVQTEEKEVVVDQKKDENKRSVIGRMDATVEVVHYAKSDDIAGITIQPKNTDSEYEDSLEKCDKTKDVSEGEYDEKNDAEIDVKKRVLNKQNPKWRHPKCRKQRNSRPKRIHMMPVIKRHDVTYTIPGVLKTTGGSGAKTSSSTRTNTKQNTSKIDSRRRSIQRRQSGGGDGKLDGGGCGGEPPTPPDNWMKKPPSDGPVLRKKLKKRRPSKRLLLRQDSHSSLPSMILQGTAFVHNQSPCFSLPPTGVQHVPPSEFITEDFLQTALEHFQSEGSAARWLTHNCPPCKTMQAYLNHVQKCDEDTCQICGRLFYDVLQWVERCQQAEHARCYIPFCREFNQADGQEAQFRTLLQFAASFDKPGPNFTQPICYPIQREQSLTENATAMEIPDAQAADKPTDLELDSPVRSNVAYGSSQLLYHEDSQNEDLHLLSPQPASSARNTGNNRRYVRPGPQRVPVTDNNKAAFLDFCMNKPYDTRIELKHVEVGDPQPDEIWKHDIDEQEGLKPVRNQVRYGEKRHLMAFLPIWMRLRSALIDGSDQPKDLMTENDEGILFNQGLLIQDGHYRPGEEYMKMVKLGRGAFGLVHLCKDDSTHFEFVVKTIALDKFNPNEAIIWSEMDHPGIVRLLGVVRIGTNICFFSEYVAERTLKSLVENGRVLSQGDALYYLDQLLWILDYLHKKKVVHKDIKPENVIVTGEGRLLLIDWGLARFIRKPPLQSEQNPEGTQYYMAPEVACCSSYDFGVDIWSLMCIGIHLISGCPPWLKRYPNVPLILYIVGTRSPPVEDIPEDTHPQVKELLELGMTVKPSDRPNAEQLMQHEAFNLIHQLQEVAAVKQFQELDIAQCTAPPSSTEDWWPYFAPASDDIDVNCPSFSTSRRLSAITPTSCLPSPMPQCTRDGVAISSHDLPGQLRMQNAPSIVDAPTFDSVSGNMGLEDIILATPAEGKLDLATVKPDELERIDVESNIAVEGPSTEDNSIVMSEFSHPKVQKQHFLNLQRETNHQNQLFMSKLDNGHQIKNQDSNPSNFPRPDPGGSLGSFSKPDPGGSLSPFSKPDLGGSLSPFTKPDPGSSLSPFSKPDPGGSPILAKPAAAHHVGDHHDERPQPITNMYDSLPLTSVDSNVDLYGPCDVLKEHTRHTASTSTSAEKQFVQVDTNECEEGSTTKDVRGQYGELTEETTNPANNPISADKTRGQPASLGTAPTAAYACTSDKSLPGRLHRQRRPIKLAPYFSEAPLPRVDPMTRTVGTTDGLRDNQCRQVKKQASSHQMECEEHVGLPTSMQASNQLLEWKEPIDSKQASFEASKLLKQASNTLTEFVSEKLVDLPAVMEACPELKIKDNGTELKDQQDMGLRQFLDDEDDIWRFQGLEELSGSPASSAFATYPRTSSLLNAAPDDSYVTAGTTTSRSMLSADELEQEFFSLAAHNFMQQASGEESPETQLELMTAAIELQSQYSSHSNHNTQQPPGDKNTLDERFTPAAVTSGVFSSPSLHLSLPPIVPHGVHLSALQKQLSTVSSTSSNDGSGIRVCVLMGNGPECISIRMRRGQSIGDLAIGISAKVLNISYFTLTTEDGKLVADDDTIGAQQLTLVLNADPPDGHWEWRVDVNTGTIDYA